MKAEITINDLIHCKKFGTLFILARYFYRIGEPILSDAYYDVLEKALREHHYETFKEYLNRTYDDDPVPVDLLNIIGINPIQPHYDSKERSDLYAYLNEDKSFSIASVTSYAEAFPFFEMMRTEKLDVVVSLKIDGVNTKMLYENDKFALSISRGRAEGNSFDYTDNSAKIMPLEFKTGKQLLKVTGESFVTDEGLPVLRQRYSKPDGYVTGKSAAISMLRVRHRHEDYQYLKTKVFSAEFGDTLSDSLLVMKDAGFDVVPFFIIRWQEIPIEFDEFCNWAKSSIFDSMWNLGKGIPSDGVVIEVNDLHWTGVQHNQYVNRQLALKFEQWSYKVYKGVITNILIEQRRVNKSVRIEIEPIVTSDGNKARVINSYNPSILINNDLYVGKVVFFERNSNAFNTVIHGERLKELDCLET